MNRKGRGNNNNTVKVVKAKGGASNTNAPRKLSDRFDRIVHVAPKANKQKTVVVVQKKGSNPKVVKGAKGRGNAPVGKKDNKKNNKKGKAAPKKQKEKEKPKTADDLDLEMATYWHQAGKGPDPAKAKLDAEMDSYFEKKVETQTENEAATETSTA